MFSKSVRKSNGICFEFFRHIDEHHRAVLCSYVAGRSFANVLATVNIMTATIITIVVVNFVTDSTSAGIFFVLFVLLCCLTIRHR